MDALTTLFSQYSIETIILLIVVIGIAFKFVWELCEYFYTKLRKYFNHQSEKDLEYNELVGKIDNIGEKVSEVKENVHQHITNVNKRMDTIDSHMTKLEEQSQLSAERLQENTRSYLIDKHHYFCYKVKAIDDFNLQSIERRYLYYKTAGGDSFIDGLMEEIRALPRVSFNHPQIINALNVERGEHD